MTPTNGPDGKTFNTRATAALLAMGVAMVAALWLSWRDSAHVNSTATRVEPPIPQVTQEPGPDRPALSVIGYDWARNTHGSLALVGTVKNSTSMQYTFVQVEFDLYDESGKQIGTASSTANDLEPGGTWTFEALVHEEKNVAEAKLKSVTGF
jgi:hypothetical protein